MRTKFIAAFLCLGLLAPAFLSLTGCGNQKTPDHTMHPDKKSDNAQTASQAVNLMSGIMPRAIGADNGKADTSAADPIMDFSVQLFRESQKDGENTLIAPFSVLCALAMTANGANGKTLSQMETILGLPVDKLNEYLGAYMDALSSGDRYKLNIANSIWFKDHNTFTPNESFLQTNADRYGAGIYKAPFDDDTLNDINAWVSEHTDGMIPSILDQIPNDAVMYLINALAFDAEWETIYNETQIQDGIFTTETGKTQNVQMMYSEENLYLEDEDTVGFIKHYVGRKYAFAALLPKESMSIADYTAALTGKKLRSLLSGAARASVDAAIPKFECTYSTEMSEILKAMGMTDAFNCAAADFSGIGRSADGNLYISRVLHKSYIAVDEQGTKAGAATAVETVAECALIGPSEQKTVHLDRPFVYMLIDCETDLPIFIGTAENME